MTDYTATLRASPPSPPTPSAGPYKIGVQYMCAINWNGHVGVPVPADRIPIIGAYEPTAEVCNTQLTQMRDFGIDYVDLVWFWNSELGLPHENRWLDHYLANKLPGKPELCLMFDNTFTVFSAQSWDALTTYWADTVLNQAPMLKVGGRPVVVIYLPDQLKAQAAGGTDAGMRALLAAARAKGDFYFVCSTLGPHLATGPGSAVAMGFDAVTTYNIVTGNNWRTFSAAWQRFRLSAMTACELPFYIPLSAGWDNGADPGGVSISLPTITEFEAGLREAKQWYDYDPGKVLGACINAWNEFQEGSFIEPTLAFGGAARALKLKQVFGK